jgi:hypothetical protein
MARRAVKGNKQQPCCMLLLPLLLHLASLAMQRSRCALVGTRPLMMKQHDQQQQQEATVIVDCCVRRSCQLVVQERWQIQKICPLKLLLDLLQVLLLLLQQLVRAAAVLLTMPRL